MGLAAGGLAAPLMVRIIDSYGWQNTLVYLSLGILILGIPLSFLFRHRPEDYGLLPDGVTSEENKIAVGRDFGTVVGKALRMPAFWCIGLASFMQIAPLQAVALHMMPHLTSIGLERTEAALAISVFSLVSIPARLAYGILADMFPRKYIWVASLALTALGLFIFSRLDGSSIAPVLLFAVIHGLAAAGSTALRAPMVREYFGVKNFGAIFGLLSIFVMMGVVVGGPLAGWVYDTRGTYGPIWLVFSVINLAATVLILFMPGSARSSPEAG
jgi:MFS family permease